jgi:ribonuclease P protein component
VLFQRGKSVKVKGIKAIWLAASEPLEPFPAQGLNVGSSSAVRVAFVAPKKLYRLAVERNRAKRQLREAYRLQKHLLPALPNDSRYLYILFIYATKPPKTTAQVAVGVAKCLVSIAESVLSAPPVNGYNES